MTDGHRQPNSRLPGSGGGAAAGHLSDELLSELLDGTLAAAEEPAARAHLSSCARCAERFDELNGVRLLLRGLPAPLPRRSFQLAPEHAGTRGSIWDRIGLRLMPAMPALRAATIAIALLLAASVAGDLLTEPDPTGFIAEDAVPATTRPVTVPTVALTEAAGGAAKIEATEDEAALRTNIDANEAAGGQTRADESAGAAGGDPAGDGDQSIARTTDDTGAESEPAADAAVAESAPVEDVGVQEESADAPFAAGAGEEPEAGAPDDPAAISLPAQADDASSMMMIEASPTSLPSPVATPATPSPVPTAVASPSPVAPDPVETAGARTATESAWWRIAQVALGTLLVACLAGLLLVHRARLDRA